MSGQLIAGALRRCNFDVRAFSGDCLETLRELQNYKPHVSLISAKLQDGAFTGFKVVQQLRGLEPRAAAVMLLDSDERDVVVAAFRAFGAEVVMLDGLCLPFHPSCDPYHCYLHLFSQYLEVVAGLRDRTGLREWLWLGLKKAVHLPPGS